MSLPQPAVHHQQSSAASSDKLCSTENLSGHGVNNREDTTEETVQVLFCQMDVLQTYKEHLVWKEMARWVKFEEVHENGGKRWSKPHVPSLSMAAFMELKQLLSTCPVLLDVACNSMADVADHALESWMRDGDSIGLIQNHIRTLLLKHHVFPLGRYKGFHKKMDSIAEQNGISQSNSASGLYNDSFDLDSSIRQDIPSDLNPSTSTQIRALDAKINSRLMRKLPRGTEVANLMVGEVEQLSKKIGVFLRLNKARNIGNITEVNLCTRFIFIVLGPKNQLASCAAATRCMGALLTDEVVRSVFYNANCRSNILTAMEEFSNHMTVLPPGSWDPHTRIEPPDQKPPQEHRKDPSFVSDKLGLVEMVDIHAAHEDTTLQTTGRLFGGLINDVKRKMSWYKSDFTDALHMQCVASFIYLFLAALTPNVTFGGLFGDSTDQYIGTMECIVAASLTGVIYALFSGQPLNILGNTGPMHILEGILYSFCKYNGWDFMSFRCLVGLWTAFFLLLLVAFDLSVLVKFITRFTEESFACLIALNFIYEAFEKVAEIQHFAPAHFHPPENSSQCICIVSFVTNRSNTNFTQTDGVYTTTLRDITHNVTSTTQSSHHGVESCKALGGNYMGDACLSEHYVPDVFFFSWILFLGTFCLVMILEKFRNSLFFPTFVRQYVSDFAVLIAIVAMVGLDIAVGIHTPKLIVPSEFKPTRPDRSWFINPVNGKNPWWLYLLSAIPALLTTIILFMDQQITAVIINRKENKLKKGAGYHLDMLVIAFLVVILSLFGLPWYVAATVASLAHVVSLKKESECTAPGEKPDFHGIREQRVTALMVGIFTGLAVLITSVLKYIPMPVLYGVFLYMGVAALNTMQFIQRIMLAFMPLKYQPDYIYLRHVPLRRVHLYTAFQVLCLIIFWVVKSVNVISVAFPVVLYYFTIYPPIRKYINIL
ncbi:hypothetical protein ACJMK2_014677, partial [Sinanodonta woodiana]